MTLFWILASTLVVAVLVALLRPLLWPGRSAWMDDTAASNLRLLREQMAELDAELAAGTLEPEQHAAARAELERRVLEETAVVDTQVTARPGRASALALAVAVPALAVVLYAVLGNRQALDPAAASAPVQVEAPATAEAVEALVQRLADRMKSQPEDPNGWALLGRAYSGMERFEEARDAYAQAVRRQPTPDASLLADYADVLAMTLGRRLAGEPEKLIQQALALEPDHLKALALAGSLAMERDDFKGALKHWERARAVAPPDSPFARGLDPGIEEARSRAGLPPLAAATPSAAGGPSPSATVPATAPAPAPVTAPAAAGLAVTVEIAPALAAQIQPGDTLFVFARAAQGPRMPLAIVRQPATAGTVQVRLDDASAMSPQLRLSGFPQVVVGARISRSGNATPQPGDLEGESPVVASAGQTRVRIERVRP